MSDRIKKHLDLTFILGVGLVLFVACIINLSGFKITTNDTLAATGTVEVTATVQEWLTFSISPTSTDLGDLVDSVGVAHIGSSSQITLTTGTNSADGYHIDVHDLNSGIKSAGNTIQLSAATATIVAGTAGYGIQAESSGATVDPNYNFASSTNDVGRITSAPALFAQQAAQGSGLTTKIMVKAAAPVTQPSGSYTDTITFTTLPAVP